LAEFQDRCSRRFHNFHPPRPRDAAPLPTDAATETPVPASAADKPSTGNSATENSATENSLAGEALTGETEASV